MRIAFMGKGGSGKTTLTGGFTKYVANNYKKRELLVIDADINVHLQQLLGISGNPKFLGNLQHEIQKYVLGNRRDLSIGSFPPTTLPIHDSKFIYPKQEDPFIKHYSLHKENISFLTIGKFEENDVGHSCYHGKLNSLEIFFHHLLDTNHDLIVTDAVTGIDNFGTSLWFCYDLNIFVVEPTNKSISVFKDYQILAEKNKVNYKVVINKIVHEEDDLSFVLKNIDSKHIIGHIPYSHEIRKWEQGDQEGFDYFVRQNTSTRENIKNIVDTTEKNRGLYKERLEKCHNDNCSERRNDYYKKDFTILNDPSFSYEKEIGVI